MHNSKHPLSRLSRLLSSEMTAVINLIKKSSEVKDSELVSKIVGYVMSSGGKHIRPLLAIAAAKLLNYEGENHKLLAAAVECIHTATLLHDDVIDQSMVRRKVKTSNAVWGNQAAILVGDYLFSQSFKFMVDADIMEAMSVLANASSVISEAEVWQLQLIDDTELSEDKYYKLITAKTAELFAAACKVGGIAASANKELLDSLYQYGLNFGIVFQITDDLLDYFGKGEEIGKKVGEDFFEGKITLPLILLFQAANQKEKEIVKSFFKMNYIRQKEDLEVVLSLLDKHQINRAVTEKADFFVSRGQYHISKLPDSEINELMFEILHASINRKY